MSDTKQPTFQAPLIHLNGDTKDTLLSALLQAAGEMREAQKALAETAPNQRNFYPLPLEAWRLARAEYQSRQERLQSVYNELMALSEAIQLNKTEAEISPSAFFGTEDL